MSGFKVASNAHKCLKIMLKTLTQFPPKFTHLRLVGQVGSCLPSSFLCIDRFEFLFLVGLGVLLLAVTQWVAEFYPPCGDRESV